jgi:PEP-CTERM motif
MHNDGLIAWRGKLLGGLPGRLNVQRPTTSSGFEQQLEVYSATSKSVTSTSNWRDRLGSWPMYAAATASALACATSASAGIIYSGPLDLTAVAQRQTSGSYAAFIAMPGLNGEILFLSRNSSRSKVRFTAYHSGAFRAFSNGLEYVKRFASHTYISAAGAGSHQVGGVYLTQDLGGRGHRGPWAEESAPGFVGFALKSIYGGYDYGWLRIALGFNNAGQPDQLTVFDYAYNDVAGQGIEAGSVTTPEPATKAMMLLAAGFAGVLAWRRRRSAV